MPYDYPNANPYAQQQGLDPALVQQILALQQQSPQQAAAARSFKLADQLRSDAGDQLKGMQVGRRYVAPGAANAVASLAQNYMAAKTGAGAESQLADLGTKKTAAMKSFWDMLNARTGKNVPEPASAASGYGVDY